MNTMKLLTALSLLGFSTVSLSCDVLECGEGTTERNGECVLADGTSVPPGELCADGTHYDNLTLGCEADFPPTVCDEATTTPETDEFGIIHCMGTGGGNNCSLPCPVPTTNKNTICGQLVNAEDNLPIQVGADPDGTACDPENPEATGPCALTVAFYDALGFAQNPTGTPPQTTDSVTINNCGRYAGVNIATPALGFLAVGVNDNAELATDDWIFTGVAFPINPGDRRTDQVVYVVASTTDRAWTDTAELPFGAVTFAEKGVFFPIYLSGGEPVSGVKITRDPAGVVVDDDYYFDDTDPYTRSSVNKSQDATGVNGAGLMVDSGLVNHSGVGGLPAECEWPSDLAKSIPGVVFANERHAENSSTGDPCGE